MNILLFTSYVDLVRGKGGIERVLCHLASTMIDRGHHVVLACDSSGEGLPFFELDPRIQFVNVHPDQPQRPLKGRRILRELLNPLRKLHLIDHLPDPMMAARIKRVAPCLDDLIQRNKIDLLIVPCLGDAIIATYGVNRPLVPVILMHHFNPEIGLLNRVHERLTQATLQKCSYLQLLLPGFKEQIVDWVPCKIAIIPNVVPQISEDLLQQRSSVQRTSLRIVCVGRLDSVHKRQHLLIAAFAKLAREYPHWTVECYGEEFIKGYRKSLEKLIAKNNLTSQVFLRDVTNRVLSELLSSDIFAFPSKSEGFSLALTEAMAAGLPCLGFRTNPSVSELVVEGVNGFLADDSVTDFAAKLKILMDDAPLRTRLGENGREMMKQYAPDVVADKWELLMRQAVTEHHPPLANKITVLTPTYNRANLLKKAYESLLHQTDSHFEWVIVDDGSTDETQSLIQSWIQDNHFPIRFIQKENGGKHTAINLGVLQAQGELTLILDSDDFLAEDAIETIRSTWNHCEKSSSSGGMVFLRGYFSTGKSISSPFPRSNYWANTIRTRHVDLIKGDKAEVYRTDILREYPFPVFPGETFLTEDVVWNRIAKKYELLHVNQIIYWGEYLPDGLTHQSAKKNPFADIQGQILNLNEKTTREFPLLKRIGHCIEYMGKSLHVHSIRKTIEQAKSPFLCTLLLPLGMMKYARNLIKKRKRHDP